MDAKTLAQMGAQTQAAMTSQAAITTSIAASLTGVQKYARRIENATGLIAQFAAENEQRLVSGEWTLEQVQGVIADTKISKLLSLLQSGSYASAIAQVQALSGGVYTDELKAAWVARIQAAM